MSDKKERSAWIARAAAMKRWKPSAGEDPHVEAFMRESDLGTAKDGQVFDELLRAVKDGGEEWEAKVGECVSEVCAFADATENKGRVDREARLDTASLTAYFSRALQERGLSKKDANFHARKKAAVQASEPRPAYRPSDPKEYRRLLNQTVHILAGAPGPKMAEVTEAVRAVLKLLKALGIDPPPLKNGKPRQHNEDNVRRRYYRWRTKHLRAEERRESAT